MRGQVALQRLVWPAVHEGDERVGLDRAAHFCGAAVGYAYDGDIVMVDTSCVRVHQHGAAPQKAALPILAWDGPVAA